MMDAIERNRAGVRAAKAVTWLLHFPGAATDSEAEGCFRSCPAAKSKVTCNAPHGSSPAPVLPDSRIRFSAAG